MDLRDIEKRLSGHIPSLQNARAAFAVLVPLVRIDGALHLLFEVRADSLDRQPGEVCFPGGKIEAGENAVQAALRETTEELSVPVEEIRPVAALDFLYHQSNSLIHPILAVLSKKGFAALRPSPDEVKEVFTVPLSFFLSEKPMLYSYELMPHAPENFPYHLVGYDCPYPFRAGQTEVPIYLYENHAVWGITGRICQHLAQTLAANRSKKDMQYQHIQHPIAPLYRADSKILILGSFPSVKSREGQFFYHHPQNRFWRVIAALTGEAPPTTIEEKTALLLRRHIALWDVIASCDIIGSSDSSIKNVTVNDLTPILTCANIARIYTNGAAAGRLYQKYILPSIRRDATVLPSTSPANAAYSFDRLVDTWRAEIPDNL